MTCGQQLLLTSIVNQLGDSDRKLASKTTHLLQILIQKHPAMKAVVIGEVRQLLYRPNIKARAQYYAMCFLNQIELNGRTDKAVANQLLTLYFAFFKVWAWLGGCLCRPPL